MPLKVLAMLNQFYDWASRTEDRLPVIEAPEKQFTLLVWWKLTEKELQCQLLMSILSHITV